MALIFSHARRKRTGAVFLESFPGTFLTIDVQGYLGYTTLEALNAGKGIVFILKMTSSART